MRRSLGAGQVRMITGPRIITGSQMGQNYGLLHWVWQQSTFTGDCAFPVVSGSI
jgi:hypothetical protein